MAREVTSIVGSGTQIAIKAILPPAERGSEATGQGFRHGTQVAVANPEDLNSVDAFVASGVPSVGTTAVEILSPGSNPLPRMREVTIQNLGSADVYVGHSPDSLTILGYEITAPPTDSINSITIPVMHNVSIWAATATGTANVRMLIL